MLLNLKTTNLPDYLKKSNLYLGFDNIIEIPDDNIIFKSTC